MSDEELARLYGEAEVAIVPSLYEGFSLPAIEAMSCGGPGRGDDRWRAARSGRASSGETGLLVEPNNPDALVEAIAPTARRRRRCASASAPPVASA